ncbi:MAG: tetratricopeptide repeat protein [Roseiflexaceae bacterium]|nr:tetratricopeptide repeat protein [Roseiflexaceae bacterium]
MVLHQKADNMSDPADISRVAPDRLARYLPVDMSNRLRHASEIADISAIQRHLAAVRATIATYLPRRVVQWALHRRCVPPWLEWVEGSLLFADLSGSTALAEQLSALGREGTELVTDFLNGIFARMIDIVHAYGGDLISFGGDALLVLFDDVDHPRTAACAALELQHALNGYVCRVAGVGDFPMHLHVGVESGQVALISAGHADIWHYAALGAVVNGVARAEALAGPGEIVLGRRTCEMLPDVAGEPLHGGFFRLHALAYTIMPSGLRQSWLEGAAAVETLANLLDDLDRISPYIPPALLSRIIAIPDKPQIEADLRPVTALFAQVIGLEALAEVLPSAQSARIFEQYMIAMQSAIARYGGVINKLDVAEEGVKLLAIFGAPTAYEDHPERGARAALAMQSALSRVNAEIEVQLYSADDFNAQSVTPSVSLLRQQIGLNPGVVFAGNVGGATRKEYTVMGDAVNIAARVMSAAPWGDIWCSRALAETTARIVCEPQGIIPLKGKSEPLEICRIAGERESSEVMLLFQGVLTPLVDREYEMAWLRDNLEAALAGSGRAVRLVGEAGVGKSRLLAALIEMARERGMRVVSAVCLSYTASIPYAAWGELLKSLCGMVAGESDEVRAGKIAAHLSALGPGMDEWLPLLGDLVRLDIPDNRLTRGLDPQLRQERRFDLLERLLLHAAAQGSVLVVFEDLHWADPVSLELWRRVVQTIREHPILLVGAHRPTDALSDNDHAAVLEVRELPADDSDRLVTILAGDVELPETLRRQIAARAAGNPLFLAELLRAVLAQSNQTLLNSIDNLPDSLNGLLLARIDRLDEQARNVLRVASVIGQRIPFGVLQAIQSIDRIALLRQLTHLDEQEITMLERLEPERVHMFRHALLQEVAYQSMLYARRRELHGRIGEYLEQRYADDLDDYYGLLAHHYRLSNRRDKAIHYLLKAGHAARAVFANEEALQYYSWALEALAGDEHDPRGWETHLAIADVEATLGRYDRALDHIARVLGSPGISPDVAQQAYHRRGAVLEKQGMYAAALEALEQAMGVVRAHPAEVSPLAAARICADIALVRRRRGEYDLALAACEEGLAMLRRDHRSPEDEQIEARLHAESGSVLTLRGEYARAREFFERSLQAREAIDDLPGMIASHNNIGYLWQLQNNHQRALEHYRLAETLARKIGLRYAITYALGNIAYSLTVLGQYAEAEAHCREALELSRQLRAQLETAQLLNTLGIIYYRRGDYAQAHQAYEEALNLHRTLGSTDQEANALVHLAQTYSAQGDHARAAELARQALATAETLQAPSLQTEALNALVEALIELGNLEDAAAYAEQAVELSRALGADDLMAIALRLRGAATVAQGRSWQEDLVASAALCEAVQDRFELARTWCAYGASLLKTGNLNEGTAYLKRAYDTFIVLSASGEASRIRVAYQDLLAV